MLFRHCHPSEPDRPASRWPISDGPHRQTPKKHPFFPQTGRSKLVLGLAVACLLVASACGGATASAPAQTSPMASAEVSPAAASPDRQGAPGDVIVATEADPPNGGRAWIVDHHSASLDGRDIAVRAILAIPMVTPPKDGFPVIIWGHASKGVADSCAPSHEGPAAVPLIDNLIAAGYAVVAPDYEGLGAHGTHPYMVGESEGRSMLDGARAATRVKGSGVTPLSPVILWGFSQGGQAAAFAAEIGPTYAPEVQLKGVAMAAPVADISNFVKRSENWPEQFGLLVTIAYAFSKTYPGLPLDQVLTPGVLAELDVLEQQCVREVTTHFNRPIPEMLVKSPREVPAFAQRLQESQAGQRAISIPVLVVQGNIDQIVDPADTDALVRRYCDKSVKVSYLVRADENHNILSDDILLPWTRGRLIGDEPPDNCHDNRSSRTPATGL